MKVRMSFILVSIVYVTSLTGTCRGQQFEDEACQLANGAVGYCKKFQDCPEIPDVIRSGKTPVICSFNQNAPIFCCSKNSTNRNSQPSVVETSRSSLSSTGSTSTRSSIVSLSTDEGCILANGAVGHCKEIQDCPTIEDVIRSGKRPVICYFRQTTPIICCSENSTNRNSQPSVVVTTGSSLSSTESTLTGSSIGSLSTAGDPCTLNTGSRGVCTELRDCPAANTIESANHPKRCHHQQSDVIVCCPTSRQSTSVGPPRTQHKLSPPEEARTTRVAVKGRTTTIATTTPIPPGKTSAAMCEYYGQFVFELVQSATLFITPEWFNESQCNVEVRKNAPARKVVGEVGYKEYPHMTRLGYGNERDIQWNCAGSLISENFILTASLCIDSPNSGRVRWARVGDLKPTKYSINSREIQEVVDWITPESTQPSIALLRLGKYMPFSGNGRPACLYTELGNPPGYRFATTIGWGMDDWDDTETTEKMMKQDLVFSSSQQCSAARGRRRRRRRRQRQGQHHSRTAGTGVVCVTYPPDADSTCVGGLGSPLHIVLETPYCVHSILGVNTGGQRGCPSLSRPAVFTRIADLIPWIESHVWA